jgi:hypothetical protein
MKWGAQVGHVFVKDVRYARWAIGLFLVAAVIAVLRAFVSADNPLFGSALPAGILTMLGVAIAAFVVQADPPAIAKAFWASRPFSPIAVLAAKLVFVLAVILTVPLVLQVAALRSFNLEANSIAALALGSATEYAAYLVLAVVVAALTPDLRSFGLVYIVAFVLTFVIASVVSPSPSTQSAGPGSNPMTFISYFLYAGLLCYVYLRREANLRAWLGVPAIFLVNAIVGNRASYGREHFRSNIEAPRLTFAAVDAPQSTDPERFRLHVSAVGGSSDVEFALAIDAITVHLLNGEAISLNGFRQGAIVRRATLPTAAGPVQIHDSQFSAFVPIVGVQISEAESAKIRIGVSRVDLDGHLLAVRPRLVTEFASPGARTIQLHGSRMHVHDVTIGRDQVTARVETDSFDDEAGSYNYGTGQLGSPTIALVGDSLNMALLMVSTTGGGGAGWFVLPGVSVSHQTQRLQMNAAWLSRSPIGFPSGWLQHSHVAVYDWERLGSVAVHQTIDFRGG